MRAASGLISEVRRQTESAGLAGSTILAAVSGGPDSLALVHALSRLRDDLDIRLFAAHLDHGLRPGVSESDAEFVREAMADLEVPLTSEKADVGFYKQARRLSIEDAARQVRYNFLSRVSDRVEADAVAVGHTLDDQAETVLMHVLRGSGLTGLRGMAAVACRSVDGVPLTVFRPLLGVSKADTVAYCAENGLSPRFDESNLSEDMTRNRIRMSLMPRLESYNPAIAASLGRLAESVSHDLDFIRHAVDRAAGDVIVHSGFGVVLDRSGFAELPPAIQRHLLRRAVEMTAGAATDLEFTHVEEMMRLMAGPAGNQTHLPGQVTLDVDRERAYVSVGRSHVELLPEPDFSQRTLAIPGRANSGGWTISARTLTDFDVSARARRSTPAPSDAHGLRLTEKFDADALGSELYVRTRRQGDVFRPIGMGSEKRLSDFMKDSHVPARWRDRLPVMVTSSDEVVWVVGWRIADWAKITDDTRRVVEVSCAYDDASGSPRKSGD